LIDALVKNGWTLDEEGDYVLVNGYVRLGNDRAIIGDMEAVIRREVSYRQALAWITNDVVALTTPD